MIFRKFGLFSHLLAVTTGMTLACSDTSKDAATTTTTELTSIDEQTPDNSTGATGMIEMQFSNSTAPTLALTTATQVLDGITIEAAKFSIAAIKIKAAKEQTADEVKLDKVEKEEDEEAASEVDAAAAGTSLVAKPGKTTTSQKGKTHDEKVAMKANLLKDKAKFKAKASQELAKHKERDKSLKRAGPYVYDAILGKLESDIEPIDLTDGSYRRIEFKLRRNWDVDEIDPLLGNVFYLHGTYTKDGVATPFEVDYHIAMNFRLRGEGSVDVEASAAAKLAVCFDLDKWFEGVDLSAATIDETSGKISINKNSNSEILKSIRANIKKNVKFGRDADGDGVLASTETAGTGEAETGDSDTTASE